MATLTIKDVLARLPKQAGPLSPGSPDTPVTGIAVTWSPTLDVLKRAVANRQNLIVSLEPPFWNRKGAEGRSPTDEEFQKDPTWRLKTAYLAQNNLAILQVRDAWLARPEDGQLKGLAKALGWQLAPGKNTVTLPATSFGDLASTMKRRLKAKTIRCIGDPKIRVSNIALTHGYILVPDLQKVLEDPKVDVVVCGEPCEWEAGPYFMDLVASGKKKGMVVLGTQVSSEPGCVELTAWLKSLITEVPVEFVPAGEPFTPVS